MKVSNWIVIGIVLYGIIGDLYFREFFHTLWIIIWMLFFIFLIIHGWLEHKGAFLPKKKDKEG